MIDERTFRDHITKLIRLTEHYLAIPDQDEIGDFQRPESLNIAIQEAIDVRMAFLDYALANDIRGNQEEGLKIERTLLDGTEFNDRQRLIIEYELSFLGINPVTKQIFMPMIVLYLTNPAYGRKAVVNYNLTREERKLYKTRGVDPGHIEFSRHLIDDMLYFEKARWSYSRDDEYAEETDLSSHLWCAPETFDELRDEITNFLKGKRRILEVGFLHQRVHDLIMGIDPSTEYHGVDISIPAVKIAREKGITAFNCNCWYAIPYPDGYFDGIISSTVRASGLDPYKCYEIKRVLSDPKQILNFDLQ
jgi:hypothetical protein